MIYVSSACIKKNRIDTVICQMAESGIRNIELSGGTDYYDGIEHDLREWKERYQLKYACHAYFPPPKEPFVVNLASCNDEIYRRSLEHYDNCIDLLQRIGCSVLSIHAGFLIEIEKSDLGGRVNCKVIYDEGEAYSRFCYAYERLSKRCRERNIKLYLENNVLSHENYIAFEQQNYFMMTDYQSILYMKEKLDFDLLLDLGHLYVSSNTLGLTYEKQCEYLKPHVRWIHVSENNGIRDEHKPLQEESVILKELYKIYTEKLNVTLETVGEISDILKSLKFVKGGESEENIVWTAGN
ncbi:MAG: sugar phosphate isomerase/epimerase [Dorea sp.]|jgi:sugar phosphate isomerase/epimerase|nr:sugar phosphate isomerase/epimerase [Dorea sp.]